VGEGEGKEERKKTTTEEEEKEARKEIKTTNQLEPTRRSRIEREEKP